MIDTELPAIGDSFSFIVKSAVPFAASSGMIPCTKERRTEDGGGIDRIDNGRTGVWPPVERGGVVAVVVMMGEGVGRGGR